MSARNVLVVDGLRVRVQGADGGIDVVRDLSFELARGEVLAIVGESGSGKSMTALAILGLLPGSAAVTGGRIDFDGQPMVGMKERQLRAIRGREIAMVFQDPMSSLNPVHKVGTQLCEALTNHAKLSRRAAWGRAVELLKMVGVPDPAARARQYPHEFSGGMRQRVMIAMAVANRPRVLIADEPTTALDVTIEAQILDLLEEIRRETGTAIVLISHNLGVVAEVADHVLVMYGGRAVETGPVEAIFGRPAHPYTRALLSSIPSLDGTGPRISPIPGQPPSPAALPGGCAFHPRCTVAQGRAVCAVELPRHREVGPRHVAACHFAEVVGA